MSNSCYCKGKRFGAMLHPCISMYECKILSSYSNSFDISSSSIARNALDWNWTKAQFQTSFSPKCKHSSSHAYVIQTLFPLASISFNPYKTKRYQTFRMQRPSDNTTCHITHQTYLAYLIIFAFVKSSLLQTNMVPSVIPIS